MDAELWAAALPLSLLVLLGVGIGWLIHAEVEEYRPRCIEPGCQARVQGMRRACDAHLWRELRMPP